MRKKEQLKYQINNNLRGKIAFGESKFLDKQGLKFGESTYKIYSYSTYETYKKECLNYCKWLTEVKGIDKFTKLENTEKYVEEYIQSRLDNDYSAYTVKMEKSALSMLYSHSFDIKLPIRDNKNITRSRNETVDDIHYSRTGKYEDVFNVALGTGCRRCDLENLRTDCLREKDGHLYIQINGSKGGRDRLSYVREEYRQQIEEYIHNRQSEGYTKVFDKIPRKIDVHSLRREYCQKLYKDIKDNRELRDDILKNYPERKEYKTNKDKDGISHTKEIQSDYYKDRDGNIYNRDDIYVLSQTLGHNRLDVSVTHYLKR